MGEKLGSNKKNADKILLQKVARIYLYSFLLYIFVLGIIYQYIALDMGNSNKDFSINFLSSSFGSAIGMGIVPLIIAIVRSFQKRKPTKKIFIIYFIISTLVFYFSLSSILNNDSLANNTTNKLLNSVKIGANSNNFVYHYPGNEFNVVFESYPKISNISAPFNDTFLDGEVAELVIPKNKSFYRAECLNFDKTNIPDVNKEYIRNYLNKYSIYTGLSFPTFQYEETYLGKIGSLRAYKTLKDKNGGDWKITYFVKTFFGKYSTMSLYVGGLSEEYPTPSITKFLNSVTKYND
ncbi:MAG: hypothetical protein IID03_05880 [Candidatus Dadabacteria bacterium]|nr:hypothetical protein [Candidatus Dadabacteria bacterium]